MQAAQAFGLMAILFGGLVLAAMVVAIFVRFPRWTWMTLMITLFIVAPFQLITLASFGSEICTGFDDDDDYFEDFDYRGCVPLVGAYLSILAFCCWLTGAILIWRLPPLDKATVNCGTSCGSEGSGEE